MSGLFSSNDIEELDNNDASAMDVDVDNDTDERQINGNDNNNIQETEKKDNINAGQEGEGEEEGEIDNETKEDPTKGLNIPIIPELTRADKTLDELLDLLDDPDFTPIIPDAVTDYYLAKSGLSLGTTTSSSSNALNEATKIKRLLALATQKFISDIATDAYEYSRIRCNSAVYAANNPQARSRALMMATMAKARGTSSANHDVSGNSATGANAGSTNANGNEDSADGDIGNIGGSSLNSGSGQGKEKVTLTMDDLSSALDEYGLNINRPQFYR